MIIFHQTCRRIRARSWWPSTHTRCCRSTRRNTSSSTRTRRLENFRRISLPSETTLTTTWRDTRRTSASSSGTMLGNSRGGLMHRHQRYVAREFHVQQHRQVSCLGFPQEDHGTTSSGTMVGISTGGVAHHHQISWWEFPWHQQTSGRLKKQVR